MTQHADLERLPGRRSWRRWRVTGKFSLWLYSMGISCGGGGMSMHGGDPYGPVYNLPPLWSYGWKARPYLLGKPDWWWACLRRQFPRFTHRPGPEITALGRHCGTCDPWWCCGAPGWTHTDDCPEYPALIDGSPLGGSDG